MNSRHSHSIIIFCIFILSIFIFRENKVVNENLSLKPALELHVDGKKLILNKSESTSNEPVAPVHLAPFFFQPMPVDKVNIDLLVTIPGIGPKLAEKIIMLKREKDGPISKDDLRKIKGIGPKKLAKIDFYLRFNDTEENH